MNVSREPQGKTETRGPVGIKLKTRPVDPEEQRRVLELRKIGAENLILSDAEMYERMKEGGNGLTDEQARTIEAAQNIKAVRLGAYVDESVVAAGGGQEEESGPVSLQVYHPVFRQVGGDYRKRGTGRLEATEITKVWWHDARDSMVLDLPERPKPGSLVEVETSGAQRGFAHYRVTRIPREAKPEQRKNGLFMNPISAEEFDELREGTGWHRKVGIRTSFAPPKVYSVRVPEHKRESQIEEAVRGLRKAPASGTVA